MLYFDRIDVTEGIDVNEASASKEVWYLSILVNYSFNIQRNVCNRYHYLLMVSRNLSNIAILNIKSADYRCIISGIRANEAINLMQNVNFTKENGTL